MSDEIVFYTNPFSRGRIVRWMLEEVGQPYHTKLLEYGTSIKAPEYLAINPMGKVPTLVHRGVVVTECAAICAYLADAFPAAGLAPALDDPLRGPYYRWLFFAAGPIEAVMTNQSLGVMVPEDKIMQVGYGRPGEAFGVLEEAVSQRPYILGHRFSAADVVIGSYIGWSLKFDLIEKRPAFVDYWNRLADRPANLRAEAIDDALLGEQQAAS